MPCGGWVVRMVDPFRKQALDRLTSPEDLDRLVRVTKPGTWIALVGLLLVVAGVVLWATLATVTTTVSGLGYVLPEGGLTEASTPRPGTVKRLDVAPGQFVRKGDPIAVLSSPGGAVIAVDAPADGQVGEVVRAIGDFVPEGGEVAILVPLRRPVVEAFLPTDNAKEARVGDEVWVAPTTAEVSEFGYARGRVASIGQIPISDAGIDSVLENQARLSRVAELGPVIHVVVALTPASTASGVSWTASDGPPDRVTIGTRAEVKVVTGRRAPIDYVVG